MNKIAIRPATVLICVAVALPLLAAEKLSAKIGQWETTTTMNMGGAAMPAMPALPPEILAQMPPAQRAQMEQAMSAMSGKPVTTKSCVTEKDLADGAFRGQQQGDMKCTYTVVSSTPKRQETTFQCTSAAGPADGKLVVDVVDESHVKGTMQIKAQQMSIETKFDSKWLGACATAK
ncbi:MAG: DUF3617 domain-containing protein [Steroidobacteraceae bacterium]